jgi:hypothetical protein
MKINFTKKQFEVLLKAVYMGNWMANAHRTGRKDDKRIEKYEEVQRYLLSFAREIGLEKYVDDEDSEIYPSGELEESEVDGLIDEYNEEEFWEELVDRFARRDFMRKYGAEAISKMDTMERIKKDHPFLDEYHDEVYKYGIDRMEVVKNESDKK